MLTACSSAAKFRSELPCVQADVEPRRLSRQRPSTCSSSTARRSSRCYSVPGSIRSRYRADGRRSVSRQHMTVVASGINVMARRSARLPPASRSTRLTVVMPVFNERETLADIFERVYAKRLAGVDIDIVLVESNSTDGTRELVKEIEKRPR